MKPSPTSKKLALLRVKYFKIDFFQLNQNSVGTSNCKSGKRCLGLAKIPWGGHTGTLLEDEVSHIYDPEDVTVVPPQENSYQHWDRTNPKIGTTA